MVLSMWLQTVKFIAKKSLNPHHLHYYTSVVVHLQSLSNLHQHIFIAFSSKFNAFLACDSCNWDIYSCHFCIVMGVSCSFTYSTQHLQAMAMQPPSNSHHKQMPPNCGLLSSVGLILWWFKDKNVLLGTLACVLFEHLGTSPPLVFLIISNQRRRPCATRKTSSPIMSKSKMDGGFHQIWKCGIVTEETWIFLATEASIFHYFSSFRVGSSNWRSINLSISWRRSIKLW
jgi:hypothetical protein